MRQTESLFFLSRPTNYGSFAATAAAATVPSAVNRLAVNFKQTLLTGGRADLFRRGTALDLVNQPSARARLPRLTNGKKNT